MKNQILKKLSSAPKLTRWDILLTLVPAILWLGLVYSRPLVITPHCVINPKACTQVAVPAIDQVSLGMDISKADQLSYATQNISGILAIAIPPLWSGALTIAGRIHPATALAWIGTDLIISAQSALWNGMIGEATRLSTQRARPFVYVDPVGRGADPAHYTSFYSGHTSFAAAAMTALFLVLLSRGMPSIGLMIVAITAQALVFLTGIFRVMAGRHFITDVLVASVIGTVVAIAVAYQHRSYLRGTKAK